MAQYIWSITFAVSLLAFGIGLNRGLRTDRPKSLHLERRVDYLTREQVAYRLRTSCLVLFGTIGLWVSLVILPSPLPSLLATHIVADLASAIAGIIGVIVLVRIRRLLVRRRRLNIVVRRIKRLKRDRVPKPD